MLTPQHMLDLHDEIEVDLFAGGGGASTGIEQATGRPVAVAVNHDADAVGMHEVNHPQTRHHLADVWEVDPVQACGGRPVGLLHASPDCTHHSQAKGGQPRDRQIRALSWVVHRWAGKVRPRVITLENVEQILQWSPLVAKRDPATGRVLTLDVDPATGSNRVAAPGERTPVDRQFLVPDRSRRGHNWAHFVDGLRRLGYVVQWRVICNADLGAHSTRERLYMVARCDGQPIVWPEQTHARKPKAGQQPWRAAHECIDWTVQGRSIFGRDRPLAEATMRRIAVGMQRYVLGAAEPFIVPVTHTRDTADDVRQPLRTITTAKGGEFALAAATLVQSGHGEGAGKTKRRSVGSNDINGPVGTVTASSGGGGQSLATAFMVQANGGFNTTPARDVRDPMSTVTASGSQQQLITAHLTTLRRHSDGRDVRDPLSTVAAGGEHHGLVQYHLSQDHEAGALRCAAFLMRYHGTGGQWTDLREPMTTVTTHDRLALVTVWLQGEPWVIVDITLRMLLPRELYNAQDFPAHYIIDRTSAGKVLTKTAQVRMCGNSVSPLPMQRLVAANYSEAMASRKAA